MINVLKNRTRLCALTTSVLFFLQGADVSMGVSALPSIDGEPLLSGNGYRYYNCDVGKYGDNRNPIYCDDGKAHKVKRGSITVPTYGDVAVTAIGKLETLSVPRERQDHSINTLYRINETTIELDNVLLKGKKILTTMN